MNKVFLPPFAAISFLVGIAYMKYGEHWFPDTTPPVLFEKTVALNSPLRVGDALVVRIYRKKVRDDCPVLSIRDAINLDGQVFDISDIEWEGGPPSTEFLDLPYGTQDLPPGQYVLRVRLVYQCPGFEYRINQPDTPFRVLE